MMCHPTKCSCHQHKVDVNINSVSLRCSQYCKEPAYLTRTSARRIVQFDVAAPLVTEIPSLDDYHPIQLQNMYYSKNDYAYFQRRHQRNVGILARSGVSSTHGPKRAKRIHH